MIAPWRATSPKDVNNSRSRNLPVQFVASNYEIYDHNHLRYPERLMDARNHFLLLRRHKHRPSAGCPICRQWASNFIGIHREVWLKWSHQNRIVTGRQRAALWHFNHLQHRINSVQEKLLTVTLVTVTQYRAIWLQWHFPDFPISNLMVKFSCLQWHSISHSLTVTLSGYSRGCHCNRLLL